ncbi:MAG: alpha/beta hydrolase [Candidatus Bipolaricaulota bacterium]|nr:alpha/beta hydrolase [Candidatus Bipolaricaulota bacterium]
MEGGLIQVTSGETIYVRRAGHGMAPVILLAGNNCSGGAFDALLALVAADEDVARKYSFFAFDYRGSGGSSYHHRVESLEDFARDFADVVAGDPLLRKGNITLVGHSMGFGVAQCMVALDPSRYSGAVSLAGIGTRGVRVIFVGATVGTDPETGKLCIHGDWAESIGAVAFQQRSWTGKNRTPETVAATWNMIVYNDILKFDLASLRVTDPAYLSDPGYERSIADVLTTTYMPESLYVSHRYNFLGKNVLLVKAQTDRSAWRGDLVIADSITQNTKYDLHRAGARVTAVMIKAGIGYDHGFPIHHPKETLQLITAFIKASSELSSAQVEPIFGQGNAVIYSDKETEWEREAFGGF